LRSNFQNLSKKGKKRRESGPSFPDIQRRGGHKWTGGNYPLDVNEKGPTGTNTFILGEHTPKKQQEKPTARGLSWKSAKEIKAPVIKKTSL